MSLAKWDKQNVLKFSVDYTKIDTDLIDFPVLLNLSSSSAINNYDCSNIFDTLTTIDTIFQEQFINGNAWENLQGSAIYDNGYLQTLNDNTIVKTTDSLYIKDFVDVKFDFKNHGTGSYNDQYHVSPLWESTNDRLTVYMRTNSSSSQYVELYKVVGGTTTTLYTCTKYDFYTLAGTWFSVRINIDSGGLKFKLWITTEGEPTSWDYTGTFSLKATNYFFLSNTIYTSGNGTGLDNINITSYKSNNKKIAVVYPNKQEHYVQEYDEYTKLLIHSDTNDGSINFTDASTGAHNLLVTGNTHHSAAQQKFGATSIYFDGDGDLLQATGTLSDWAFGTEDFTVDWWEYRTNAVTDCATCSTNFTSGTYRGLLAGNADSSGNLVVYMSSNGTTWDIASGKSLGTASLNEWVHLAVVRQGTTFYLFKNGILTDTWESSLALHDDAEYFTLGANQSGYYFQGYIDEFRISKGIARWTSNFTPPNSPYQKSPYLRSYTYGVNEQLYCEIENWDLYNKTAQIWVKVPRVLKDQPTDIFLYYDSTVTDNVDYVGDTASIVAQNVWDNNFAAVYHMAQDPSGTAPQILDSTVGANHGTTYGSMTSSDLVEGLVGKAIEFDGVDDYVEVANPYDWNDQAFTIEFMANVINTTTLGMYYDNYNGSNNNRTFISINHINTNGVVDIFVNNGASSGSAAGTTDIRNNYHLITARSDGNLRELFVDNNIEGTLNLSGDVSQAGNMYLAAGTGGTDYYLPAYIAEVRISNIVRPNSWVKATNYTLRDELFNIAKADIYNFSGYVKELGLPVQRTLYLYCRETGELMDRALSDPNTGYYLLKTTSSGLHNIICKDADTGKDFNDLISSKLLPIELL